MLILISEDFKTYSSTIDLCDKTDDLSIARLFIEKHSLARKISCVLKIIQRCEEHDIASDKSVIIFENKDPHPVGHTRSVGKSKNKGAENIILL